MKIENWNPEKDGPFTEQALRRKLESLEYQITKREHRPGTFDRDHYHITDRVEAVVSGRLQVKIDGKAMILKPGDYLEIYRGTIHSTQVDGNESVVSFDGEKP